MARAGVFIGVNRSGHLRELQDATRGATRMYEWAIRNGVSADTHASLITDESDRVSPERVYDAIDKLTRGPRVDQLLVYFAGHGVSIGYNEYWLLSDAPRNVNSAINVRESVELARFGNIGHVVMISDACRVAPEGIQAQSVRGSCIFPSMPLTGPSQPVDQFYSCTLGSPAHEFADPEAAARTYRSLYTDAFIDGLSCNHSEFLEEEFDHDGRWLLLRPRGMDRFLRTEVFHRLQQRGLTVHYNQEPDAILTSERKWLARTQDAAVLSNSSPEDSSQCRAMLDENQNFDSSSQVAAAMLHHVLDYGAVGLENLVDDSGHTGSSNVELASAPLRPLYHPSLPDDMIHAARYLAQPFGKPDSRDSCEIRARGANIVRAILSRPGSDAESVWKLYPNKGPTPTITIQNLSQPSSAVVEFEDGSVAVVACLPDYVVGLTIEDNKLVNVTYDWRFENQSSERSSAMLALRGVAALSASAGRFRLDGETAPEVAAAMRKTKLMDPTLAVYAAHAFYDIQDLDAIRGMNSSLISTLGRSLYDISLLSRLHEHGAGHPQDNAVPFLPQLTQAWPIARAHGIRLHPMLDGIELMTRNSLWTHLEKEALPLLRDALYSGAVS